MAGLQKDEPMRSRSAKMTAAWTSVEVVVGAIGVIMVVLGALIAAHWEQQVDDKFQQEMVLTPTSEGVKEWTSPSLPITSYLYFWNWTNAADIGQVGYKPVLKEIGPYTFSEQHFKVNMTWNDNGTVSYRMQKFYYFRRDLSVGDLSDNITSVNVIAATMSELSQSWSRLAKMPLSMALVSQQQKISWTRSVGELTFHGFHNPIQSFGSYVSSTTKDKFGFFYDFNGTVSPDVITMSTGADDIYTLGQVRTVNYVNSTPAHSGSCSNFHGSLGELWSPHLTRQSVLSLFSPDMCRPIPYFYEGESSHNGIPSVVFSSNAKSVDNGSLVAENACFCHPSGCEPAGLYDLRTCKFGAPVYMSLPHLYLADPLYRSAVVGMEPQPERHKFMLEMEPRTGIPLKVAARVQLNVKILQNKGLSIFRNVETVLLPVWWMETVSSLPTTHTSGVQLLLTVIACGPYVSAVIITIGSLILLCISCRRLNACRSLRRDKIVHVVDIDKSSYGLIGRSQFTQSTNNSDLPTQSTKHDYIPADMDSQVKPRERVPLMSVNNNSSAAAVTAGDSTASSQTSSDTLDVRL